MVGSVVSTFARWAAILGNARVARLYIHDTMGLRTSVDRMDLSQVLGFDWTHPKLRERVLFPVFQSEYMEREGWKKLILIAEEAAKSG